MPKSKTPSKKKVKIERHTLNQVLDDQQIRASLQFGDSRGAFLIRNSWGTSWGDRGYGWLPYEYVLRQLAVDWWSLLKAEWVDTKKFEIE